MHPRSRNGHEKFIEKTVNCTRSKYREYNKIYREALISLEIIMMNYHDSVKPIARLAQELEMRNIIKCQDKLRYKKYTMKSLILAQDER